MVNTALVVIARYPEAGKTKTRLGRTIGDQETAMLYLAFLTDLAQKLVEQPAYDLCWTYTPAESDYAAFMHTLVPTAVQQMRFFPQRGANLGERLHAAFHWAKEQGYQRTLVLGSDTPQVTPTIITQAIAALDTTDVVLGPAEDGGYYLLGMHQPHDLFSDIPMSTPMVLDMTIAAAHQQRLSVSTVETLFDIDEFPDLQRLARLLAHNHMLAPVTAAYITSMRIFK